MSAAVVFQQEELYLKCLRIMLLPIVRYCVRRSIKLHQLVESCKLVIVKLAAEQIKKDKGKVSLSRISVITGMHRRDAKNLLEKVMGEAPTTTKMSIASRVIGRWLENFSTKSGKPRVLSAEGEESEFFHLVRDESGHLNPYTVLYELQRTGAIEETPRGIRLKIPEFLPAEDEIELAKMMASDAEDLMSAVEENLAHEHEVPNYHLTTEYDSVIASASPKIRKWLLYWGSAFHDRARTFLSKFDCDLNPNLSADSETVRVVVGGFSRIQER